MARSTPNKYLIWLSAEQREQLEAITRSGRASAKKIRRAQVLLWSDGHREGGRISRREIAGRLRLHVNSVDRIRKQFVQEGAEPTLNRKPRETPAIEAEIDGKAEAHLIAVCCGPPPTGRVRWTLSLLAGELKRRGLVTGVCAETVRKTLKKTNLSLGASSAGACRNATAPVSSRKWKTFSISTRRSIAKKNR